MVAAGFGISVGTAHAYTAAVIDLLAARAPGLLKVLREHAPEYALLDGTLAECDRVGDGRADYSQTPSPRRERAGRDRPGRAGAVNLAGLARPVPRPDRGPHPPDHPDLRTPGRARPGRPRLPGRRPLGHHRAQTAARRAVDPHTADDPPGAGLLPGTRRTGHGTAEVLADLPKIPDQPQPHDVSRQGRPHPGEATLKMLTPLYQASCLPWENRATST